MEAGTLHGIKQRSDMMVPKYRKCQHPSIVVRYSNVQASPSTHIAVTVIVADGNLLRAAASLDSCKSHRSEGVSSLLTYLLACANDVMHECGDFASLNKCWTMICCWATEKDYKVMLNNNIVFVGGLLVCCYNGRSSVYGPIVNFTTLENGGGTIPWRNTYIVIAGKRKPGWFF